MKPTEDVLGLLLNAQIKNKDEPGARQTLDQLAMVSSKPEVWGQVIPFRRPWIGGGYNGGGSNGGWESLGTTTLSGYRDRDTLNVGLEEGRFRQLMIVIRDGQGYVSGLAVTLGNGQVMTLPVRVSSDGRGQVVDLPGDLRGVRAVTVLGGGNARVEILGS